MTQLPASRSAIKLQQHSVFRFPSYTAASNLQGEVKGKILDRAVFTDLAFYSAIFYYSKKKKSADINPREQQYLFISWEKRASSSIFVADHPNEQNR